jgi:hypothetical protein
MGRMNQQPQNEPDESNGFFADHAHLLADSFHQLTGRVLIAPGDDLPRRLYHAPFVLLSHDTAADPVFTYANLTAQRIFELPWSRIVGMASRFSAEPLAREERQRLLDRVARYGFIDDYRGVRISSTGRRFWIDQATVWNLGDAAGQVVGQAATFAQWRDVVAGDQGKTDVAGT